MPRYYFQLISAQPYSDTEGMELPDDAAAWTEAKRFARDIESNLEPGQTWRLEVGRGSRPLFLLTIASRRFN
jgi:hypothetical protein